MAPNSIQSDFMSHLEYEGGNCDKSKRIIDHLFLKNCRQFQLSLILLGMISDVLLNSATPNLLMIKELKRMLLDLSFLRFIQHYFHYDNYLTNFTRVTNKIMTRYVMFLIDVIRSMGTQFWLEQYVLILRQSITPHVDSWS